MSIEKKLVLGVGLNDANYVIEKKVKAPDSSEKKQVTLWTCPYYRKWKDMLFRAYGTKKLSNRTYEGVSVCGDWLIFSSFREWCVGQEGILQINIKDYHLDKDLTVEGNKVYSPETCLFVSPVINSFLKDLDSKKGEYLRGCYLHRNGKTFSNPFNRKLPHYLGCFVCQESAHLAYCKKKQVIFQELIEAGHCSYDQRIESAVQGRCDFLVENAHLIKKGVMS